MISKASVIAANRFGLGARPGELKSINSDPHAWLLAQVQRTPPLPPAIAALPDSASILVDFQQGMQNRRANKRADRRVEESGANKDIVKRVKNSIRKTLVPVYGQQVVARTKTAVTSESPFYERLVHFWTNHFAISADKPITIGLAGALENEAIRPLVTGHFSDLLLAVEKHPGMIGYLDNQRSMGPHSKMAKRAARFRDKQLGINENLAREILELHTLGVDGGYTQKDVTTFAEVLSGWSIGGGPERFAQGEPGRFEFRQQLHEPGAKFLLGKRYSDAGLAQGEQVLKDLAHRPATANFIALKLARHFIADHPPEAAVNEIARAFLESGGHLPTVYAALLGSQQAWIAGRPKFKTPTDFAISAFRALDTVPERPQMLIGTFTLLGQKPYTPGSPAGWPDTAQAWDGADALMKRIEWAFALGHRVGDLVSPLSLLDESLASTVSDETYSTINRADSAAQALTLFLVSPEFLKR